jgi:hypothetical protein
MPRRAIGAARRRISRSSLCFLWSVSTPAKPSGAAAAKPRIRLSNRGNMNNRTYNPNHALSVAECLTRLVGTPRRGVRSRPKTDAPARRSHPARANVARTCCLLLLMTTAWAAQAATISWIGGSGDWNTATNWSTGVLPGANDGVLIGAGASITVTHSSGTHAVKSIQSQQAFVLSGGSLTVSNTVQVNNTFTLAGGTLARATVLPSTNGVGLVVVGSSTLDGVTLNANALVQAGAYGSCASVVLTVVNGLTLNGTLTLQRPGNYWGSAYLSFAGSRTLAGTGQVVFADAGYYTNCGGDLLYMQASSGTLTIGPGTTIHGQRGWVGSGSLRRHAGQGPLP